MCYLLASERYNWFMTEDSEWLTVKEAAKISGYHPEHIRELIREGLIKGRKVSIVWLVEPKSLLAYLDNANNSEDGRYRPKGNKS